DPVGNAYVTTGIAGEHILIKYSPDGEELWVRRYSLPGQYVSAIALAVDSAGNLIAAGAAGSAFLTLKYDPSGHLLWAARDGWGGTSSYPAAMTLDNSGNVYVTGTSSLVDPGGNIADARSHFLTAKYSASGQLLWVAARPGMQGYPRPRAVRVDSQGNVI